MVDVSVALKFDVGGQNLGSSYRSILCVPPAPPCAWREGKEELCGAKCEPKVWCSVYNDNPAACNNAYAQKGTGTYGWCEHDGDKCKLVGDEVCPSGPSMSTGDNAGGSTTGDAARRLLGAAAFVTGL